jgi:hypothetical protein
MYSCKRCDTRGNRKQLLRHFGDEDREDLKWLPGKDPAMRRKALSEAAELAADMLYNNPGIMKYLKDRGLHVDTIVEARLGYAPASWSLMRELRQDNTFADLRSAGIVTEGGQDFFSNHILIPYLSHGDVVQLRGRAMSPTAQAKYVTPAGDNTRIYGSDDLHGARDVIIVEGEFDRLMVKQALSVATDPVLRATAVVSVAGAMALPDGFESYFEECRKVYVGFDPDDTGTKAALRVKEILGSKCRILHLPEDLPKCDWSDYLRGKTDTNVHGGHTWRDIQRLIFDADSEGRRLFTARDAYLQWQKIEEEIGGIGFGYGELDTWISPGLKPGQMCIPLARTGVGKTTFLANVAYNMRAHPLLLVTLEMTAPEVYNRLRRIAQFWNPLAVDDDITQALSNLRIVDQRMKPGDMTRLVEEFNDEVGVAPHMVMVDYLGYYANAVPGGSPYERVSKAVIGLKEEAKASQVALIVPHQAGRSAAGGTPVSITDARDSGVIEDTADILISLYKPSEADRDGNAVDGTVRSEILKNRNGRINVTTSLNFSLASLVLVDKHSREGRLVDEENNLIFRGENYAAVRKMRIASASINRQMRLA